MLRSSLEFVCAACWLASCATTPPPVHPANPGVRTLPEPSRYSASHVNVIADTDEMVFTDPVDLTHVRLVRLHWFIRDGESRGGELPPSLDHVLPQAMDAQTRMRMLRDGWGRPFRYRRSGDDFEIRSAGPDGRFGSADDVVATRSALPSRAQAAGGAASPGREESAGRSVDFHGETELTLLGPDPVVRTRARIANTQALLFDYCRSHGTYPQTLALALPTPRSEWVFVYDFDAWDRPLLYAGTSDDYKLQSAGADGRFDTADDLIGTATVMQVASLQATTITQWNPCAKAASPHDPAHGRSCPSSSDNRRRSRRGCFGRKVDPR
jgi:hypothetical protein